MKEWCLAHPWLTAILVYTALELATMPFRLVNHWIRHRNIVARGWPTAHCDADGDPYEVQTCEIER